jgi:hypothetical protein
VRGNLRHGEMTHVVGDFPICEVMEAPLFCTGFRKFSKNLRDMGIQAASMRFACMKEAGMYPEAAG